MNNSKINIAKVTINNHLNTYNHITHWLMLHIDHSLLQGISLGVIAFSIPILWNTVSEINVRISKHPEKHPLTILQTLNYKVIQKRFLNFVMLPTVILSFLGLIVFPIIPEPLSILGEIIVAIWFLNLIWLLRWLYKKNELDLLEYIKIGDPSLAEYQTILNLIWESSDVKVQEEFYVSIDEIYLALEKRLLELVNKNEFELVNNLYRPFIDGLKNRTVLFSLKIRSLASKTLDFNYAVQSIKASQGSEGAILSYTLEVALREILEQYLKYNEANDFFYDFEKHVNALIKKQENDNYLERLFNIYGNLLLNKMADKDGDNSIPVTAFPKNWRITLAGLKTKEDTGRIMRVWNSIFITWAQSRIFHKKYDNDYGLDRVFSYLYPSFDPPTYSKMLHYIIVPHDNATERIDYLVSNKLSFGYSSHMVGGAFGIGEGAFKQLEENLTISIQTQTDNVYKYFFDFYKINTNITKDKVQGDIEELLKRKESEKSEDNVFFIGYWLTFLEELIKKY